MIVSPVAIATFPSLSPRRRPPEASTALSVRVRRLQWVAITARELGARPGRVEGDVDDRDRQEWQKDFEALDRVERARVEFGERLCAASATDDPATLDQLRHGKAFELAHFFFTFKAMNLDGPNDAGILAQIHNDRLVALSKDKRAMKSRGLTQDQLLKAHFTADIQPRLEMIWRERPGALDQSNLARFLFLQMSSETARKLVEACCAAGVLERWRHPAGSKVVISTGFLEATMSETLRAMRRDIAEL